MPDVARPGSRDIGLSNPFYQRAEFEDYVRKNFLDTILGAGGVTKLPKDTIRLFHSTWKALKIAREGIKRSYAGVRKKERVAKVYTADSITRAVEAGRYEEDLIRRVTGKKPSKGDMMVVEIEVPRSDVVAMPNRDMVLTRDVTPDEIRRIYTKSGKLYKDYSK